MDHDCATHIRENVEGRVVVFERDFNDFYGVLLTSLLHVNSVAELWLLSLSTFESGPCIAYQSNHISLCIHCLAAGPRLGANKLPNIGV
jgi:hypothetical protein